MALDHVVLELLTTVRGLFPDLSYILKTFPDLLLATGEMAVQKCETRIIIVESDCNTTLVAALTTQASLYL